MHLHPTQPPAQPHGLSQGWVLHSAAGLGWELPAMILKTCPTSAQPLGTLGFFFTGPMSFFFQKWEDDEHDTLVAMGTQHGVCFSCSQSYWLRGGCDQHWWHWPGLPTCSPRSLGLGLTPCVMRGKSHMTGHWKWGKSVWLLGGKLMSPGWNFCCKIMRGIHRDLDTTTLLLHRE